MLKYKIESNGKATNLCECVEGYVTEEATKEGWFTIEGDIIPDIDTLHTQEYKDAQALIKYKEDRRAEYPSIAELTIALYDTDDKAAIETKRAAVKAKYPKPS